MDVELNGAKILFNIGPIPISQTLVVSWMILIGASALCWWLGKNLTVENISKRQAVAEMAVEALNDFVHGNMGETGFDAYIPLIGAIFITSLISNLISLTGLWSPTADLSTEAAWAIVVFILITRNKLRSQGIGGYLKGYLDPIFIMAPINVISELATPVSMACRHFGNILSGMVISTLIYAALAAGSRALFHLLGSSLVVGIVMIAAAVFLIRKGGKAGIGGIICAVIGAIALICAVPGLAPTAEIPWLNFGVPAVLSLYFDWFSGAIQTFIFCTLTAIFIKSAAEG